MRDTEYLYTLPDGKDYFDIVLDDSGMEKQKVTLYIPHPLAVGVLWSELIRGLADGDIASEGVNDLKRRVLPLVKDGQKIVAVFDSTYNNSTITGFRQGIGFARGIQRLLEERQDFSERLLGSSDRAKDIDDGPLSGPPSS